MFRVVLRDTGHLMSFDAKIVSCKEWESRLEESKEKEKERG